jgi:hypothetical protein
MLTPATRSAEYDNLKRILGWGLQEFLSTNLCAVNAAFVGDSVKQELRTQLLEAYSHAR